MEEYKTNSHRSKQEAAATEEKHVEKAIKGTATKKKKNEISKFTSMFISDDATDVKSYLVQDILIPAIKDTISDLVTNGLNMVFNGKDGMTKNKSTASKVSYRSYYDNAHNRKTPNNSVRSGYDYDDVILDSRGEAEEVIRCMDELIDRYDVVSVADLYDLVGVTGNYTDNKYGWTDIRSAKPVRVSGGGWIIKLPRALPLN